MKANEWKYVSQIAQVNPGGTNLAIYIFDSMAGPQVVRLS
mgnify:CR=1 FL=1